MESKFGYVEGMFKTNSDLVKKALDGIPAAQWVVKPSDCSNHLMWVAGHIIWARGNLLRTLGVDWRLSWAKQFGRGSQPEEIREYPLVDEVRKVWNDLSGQLAACLASVPAEALDKPHDKPTFDGKVGGFVAFLAFHETYHVGQVTYIRKWLGHGQLMG